MTDFEKLGVFYLGKEVPGGEPCLYAARDLTTHALCVGMTGSGKTGLCVGLLEEAAIDGIPAIAIDPKGDLGNLALTFPALRPEDFAPWVGQGESAEEVAGAWRQGLADSGQDGARIQRFRDAAEVTIYTPGSRAGRPLAMFKGFGLPGGPAGLRPVGGAAERSPVEAGQLALPELTRETVGARVAGLLTLIGVDADPLKSREHVLLSAIVEAAWNAGQSLDLPELIRRLQTPPMAQVGVLDVETFFPAKDRFALAMALNTLLASPSFAAWSEGEPLDIGRLLYTPAGRPRISVLSIGHLSDAERMFFVTLLLQELVAWMRVLPGTQSLRALLFMDEIFGFFPPTANPPAKTPMLTLLKQARAFGVGLVLATQNPVDLDYKGLANCGTWFIGRLQAERDKLRVLDGLEGAMAATGHGFDRAQMDATLSGLGKRVFLLHNVHEGGPHLFQTRFTLSYLKGPLSREDIARLQGPSPGPSPSPSPRATIDELAGVAAPSGVRPVLPPEVKEFFLPGEPGCVYRPAVLASARVHVSAPKLGIDRWEAVALVAPLRVDDAAVDWTQATRLAADAGLDRQPAPGARFGVLPAGAAQPRQLAAWEKGFVAHLVEHQVTTGFIASSLKQRSNPGESEAEFRVRLGQASREARDGAADKLRKKYATRLAALDERIRKAEVKIERQADEAERQTVDTAVSVGSTILGAILGRKVASASNLGRARSAVRSASRTMKERGDVEQARQDAAAARQQRADLEAQIAAEVASLSGLADPMQVQLERVESRPRKADIAVGVIGICWMP